MAAPMKRTDTCDTNNWRHLKTTACGRPYTSLPRYGNPPTSPLVFLFVAHDRRCLATQFSRGGFLPGSCKPMILGRGVVAAAARVVPSAILSPTRFWSAVAAAAAPAAARWLHSSGGTWSRGGSGVVEAVPFEYTIDEGIDMYQSWARFSTLSLTTPRGVVQAMYLPFWVFDADVEIVKDDGEVVEAGRHDFDPELQVYGGHTYRRNMVDVLKAPLTAARPFHASMLDVGVDVGIDAWGVFETLAIQLAKAQVLAEYAQRTGVTDGASVRFQGLTSRRVMLPAFVVDYETMRHNFRMFISGATGSAFGLQQTVFPCSWLYDPRSIPWLMALVRTVPMTLTLTSLLVNAGLLFGLKLMHTKLLLLEQADSWKHWEQVKEEERAAQRHMRDTWQYAKPASRAQRDAQAEGWAAYSQRQQQQHRGHGQGHARQRSAGAGRHRQGAAPKDHYELLGLSDKGPDATLAEVRSAFRRQLMVYHPDRAANNGIDEDTANRRTRELYDAFGVLRDPKKRAEYDAVYRRTHR